MKDNIVFRVPSELKARLAYLSETTHRPVSFYVRQALLEYLGDLEDVYLAEKELEEIRAGRSKPISTEELSRNLGLDN